MIEPSSLFVHKPGILISPVELAEAMQGGEPLVIIDTRDDGAYAGGRIPGAVTQDTTGFARAGTEVMT